MKFSHNVEPTLVIEGVAVTALPIELQNEIKTYDRLRQDVLDLAYKLEAFELASRAKGAFIQQTIRDLKQKQAQAEAAQVKEQQDAAAISQSNQQ